MTRQLKQALLLRTALLKTLSSEKEKQYCQVLNLWLRKRCTREEFDYYVSKFLSPTGIKLHTKFLSSLSKISCHLVALPLINNNGQLRKLENVGDIVLYKFVDPTLPCTAVCSARFLVFAWQSGIISVSPQIAELLHTALIVYLKDIIFTIVTTKKSFKVKYNQFRFLNTKNEQKNLLKLPSGFVQKSKISTLDFILALRLNPSLVKVGLPKYFEQMTKGPLSNNIANLIPLSLP